MRAKTINYPAPVTAFGGFEFVKYEWRDVPVGFEIQAEQHPYLETETEAEPAAVVAEPIKPKAKPKAKPTNGRRRRKATPKGTK